VIQLTDIGAYFFTAPEPAPAPIYLPASCMGLPGSHQTRSTSCFHTFCINILSACFLLTFYKGTYLLSRYLLLTYFLQFKQQRYFLSLVWSRSRFRLLSWSRSKFTALAPDDPKRAGSGSVTLNNTESLSLFLTILSFCWTVPLKGQ